MPYFKVRVEGWVDYDPEHVGLFHILNDLKELTGEGICTLKKCVDAVEEIKDIPEEDARVFFNEG